MVKKINVKPVDYLEFAFPDNTVRRAKFTTYAFATLQDEFGSLAKILEDGKNKPFETTAILLYAGMKACDQSVTYDQVREMVSDFDSTALHETLAFLQEAVPEAMSTENTPNEARMNRKNRRASQRAMA